MQGGVPKNNSSRRIVAVLARKGIKTGRRTVQRDIKELAWNY